MHQLKTAPPSGMFRTDTLGSLPDKVDRKANIIFGASLMQVGDLNEGDARPWTVDVKTLEQARELGARPNKGMKARYTHPNMSNDGMGSYLGRWKNLRVDGDTLRGDLHIADAAFSSPQGDLGTYVMDLAESDPEAFGVSLATKLDEGDLQSFEKSESEDKPERWPMRFERIRAGDVVDEPAATRGGLFEMTEEADLRELPRQATALLSTYFGDAEPEAVRTRISAFLDRYFSNREAEMPDAIVEEEVVTTPTPDLAEQPTEPETTEVAAPEAVETDTTTDFAADERERCKKIKVLCDLAGVPEKFNQFVDANFSVAETQAALKEVVSKKNPALSQDDEVTAPADENAKYKAEFAQNKQHLSVTEEQYIRSRRIDDGLESLT